MTEISRSALFGRLNPTALKAIETATGFCKMRGNPYVELVHWLHILLQDAQNDLAAIRTACNIDDTQLARDTVAALDALPRGASAISDFSPQIEEAIEKGWLYASLQFGAAKVRTGHLLYGMLKTNTLRNALQNMSLEFRKIDVNRLASDFEGMTRGSTETTQVAGAAADGGAGGGSAPGAGPGGEGSALAQFSTDLTQAARDGKIETIIGRDAEVRQLVDILLRRRQNNPILVGEAGVGKTAVVEGFAKRLAEGDVPPALQGVTLRALDIGMMQAGASVKGEFEKRLRAVIDEVEGSATPIILFIDEIHTLVGAGGAAGTGDAANLLKPALARGEWVVCDRFSDATYAYQGGGRGLDRQKFLALEQWVHGHLQPDLTFLFDLSPDVAGGRIAAQGRNLDKFEQERADFHQRVRQAYLERAEADPRRIRVVDANQALDSIKKQVEEIVISLSL